VGDIRESQAGGVDDGADGFQSGVAVGGQGTVEAFPRQLGFFGNQGHAAARLDYMAQGDEESCFAALFVQFLEGDAQVFGGEVGGLAQHGDHGVVVGAGLSKRFRHAI
jgi:hypothetical protein